MVTVHCDRSLTFEDFFNYSGCVGVDVFCGVFCEEEEDAEICIGFVLF